MSKIVNKQFDEGVWYLQGANWTAYVYSRSQGTNEIWASDQDVLPLQGNFQVEEKTPAGVHDVPSFLSWVCSRYGGSTPLVVTQQQSTFSPYNGGTHTCTSS